VIKVKEKKRNKSLTDSAGEVTLNWEKKRFTSPRNQNFKGGTNLKEFYFTGTTDKADSLGIVPFFFLKLVTDV
jgi:hypothetical protein